ncbi:flagellar basal-body rod protein FlgF [Kushneria aurantia]|uniref:Flagellar basal-body rod protein FlgF n=1 Tax=Kushneria aurantia TaxID=504092 RepID=A0ABV6G1M8_9GAMM|nr:flagellar basal-body rod protein FlgF [Kushneria aurantia]
MDRMIYTALSGAKQSMQQQSVVSNNIANVSTTGFRAQLHATRTAPMEGPGHLTRAFSVETTPGSDFSSGPLQSTGRALDVAIEGRGWLAVETENGDTAFTRNGNLQVDATGMLRSEGRPVLGDGGPVVVPLNAEVAIAPDGTVSAREPGTQVQAEVGQLMLTDYPAGNMQRREDGLFNALDEEGEPVEVVLRNENVRVASGALEGSNVSATEAMVAMIDVARSYEMNMKVLSSADQTAQRANSILSTS